MKRIIEIDDDVVMNCALYSDCQLGEDLDEYVNITELASTIAQSKPYDDSGDCISRSALKKKFEEYRHKAISTSFAIDLIDNAQAVEPLIKPIAEIKVEARLQGKWIKIFENPFTNGYICPFCGHKIQVTEQFLPEVTECESCGAKMKGGAE